jgi:type II secretory pathway pseudopilin PulG
MLLKLKLNKKYFAFTIIELSIVMLVISAIIVGISSTKLMIRKARLANAQSLTQDSIVGELSDDLVAWYETSLESSFLSSELKNDGGNISTWKDNNINAVNKNNATMTTTAYQPKLYQNAFYDSIPGLRFDGTDDYLNFDLSKIVNSAYTIFVVDQRRSNKNENYFFSGGTASTNNRIHLGYRHDIVVTLDHYVNGANFSFPSYTTPKSYIHSFVFNGNIGKRYSMNGNIKGTTSQLAPLGSTINATIAKYSGSYYNGDLAEIIIFKRSLKTEEIEAVESYLGSKYGISVS